MSALQLYLPSHSKAAGFTAHKFTAARPLTSDRLSAAMQLHVVCWLNTMPAAYTTVQSPSTSVSWPAAHAASCRCPECAHGSIDMANDGNGRWQGEWFAVPCHTGDTPMHYSIVVSSYYWFSMVISNTRYAARQHGACSCMSCHSFASMSRLCRRHRAM